ncbi:MAG: 50S ribosomal protein L17 [Spirochaetaceae bacterium]|jgi:large subunit ribosomal protein L17|nr:50S ribosomal protein L17 [Spirochaetaceae bacterium]
MKHRRGFNPLDRSAAERKALKRSMVTSLFKHERIKTTKAKALEIRRAAEKLITRAKVDSVHNRRIASARLFDEGIVAKLFTDIGPRMKERAGGYTRILKLGPRQGDAAEIVLLELVDYQLKTEDDKKAKKDKKAKADDTKKAVAKPEKKHEKEGVKKGAVKKAAATRTIKRVAPQEG